MNNNNLNNDSNTQIPNNLSNMQPVMPNQNNMNNNVFSSNLNEQIPNNDQNLVNDNIPQVNNQSNQYINYDISDTHNETSINDLNVDGDYNQMGTSNYSNDPKVIENINQHKKNTIPVSKELKTVIIIALILLVFIIIIPMIFDLVNGIRFN